MQVAAVVIGRILLDRLFKAGWKLKEKGHLVHPSGAEMIQPQPLDDRPMTARRPDGTEKQCDGLREALQFING